jgi:hypothetical protein
MVLLYIGGGRWDTVRWGGGPARASVPVTLEAVLLRAAALCCGQPQHCTGRTAQGLVRSPTMRACCSPRRAVAVLPDDNVSPLAESTKPAELTQMVKSTKTMTIDDFLNEEALLSMLEPQKDGELAPCAVIDGEWMLRRAAHVLQQPDREKRRALALPRRQDLERDVPEAFMSADRLRSLERGDERINSPLPLVCVSHCWHGLSHPDPFGDNLLVLAEAITKARGVDRFPKGEFAVFLDWCSLHQRDSSGERTPAERAAFSQALGRMNLWYAHMRTLVYLLTATPTEWPAGTLPYGARGWPSFERMITMLLKHQSSKCWATICDVGAFAPGGLGRTRVYPPKPPEEFEQMLRTLNFTNGADRRVVLALYTATLNTALGQARSLRYTGLRWGEPEMHDLVKVLPLCRNLQYLNLKGSHNDYSAASASLLADVLSRPGVMPKLKMIGAGCRDKANGEEDQGPLLEDGRLQAVCFRRGVSLLRDVPYELATISNRARPPSLAKQRSSILLSMNSIPRFGQWSRATGPRHGPQTSG